MSVHIYFIRQGGLFFPFFFRFTHYSCTHITVMITMKVSISLAILEWYCPLHRGVRQGSPCMTLFPLQSLLNLRNQPLLVPHMGRRSNALLWKWQHPCRAVLGIVIICKRTHYHFNNSLYIHKQWIYLTTVKSKLFLIKQWFSHFVFKVECAFSVQGYTPFKEWYCVCDSVCGSAQRTLETIWAMFTFYNIECEAWMDLPWKTWR